MDHLLPHAADCITRCRNLALHTEEPGFITRPFLSKSMHAVHSDVCRWMRASGMSVSIDAAGNIRGSYAGVQTGAPALFIGSHLDTVPRAGAFDGILGVVIGVKLVELLGGRRLKFPLEVIGFSEEEGVRFGIPFIGSRAIIGDVDETLLNCVADAIREFGLDPGELPNAAIGQPALGYIEFHIEQGPVLESIDKPLGVVQSIAGQTRLQLRFEGQANHAGTTPMHLRRDALAGAAEWMSAVEQDALSSHGVVGTVGRIEAEPGAWNVIPGLVKLSLDVRHPEDTTRREAVARFVALARAIADRRKLSFAYETRFDQCSVAMDSRLTELLARACASPHSMSSGAGHDAMVVARRMPAAMLFLRSPAGISHHPDESVYPEDVAAALRAGLDFFDELEALL